MIAICTIVTLIMSIAMFFISIEKKIALVFIVNIIVELEKVNWGTKLLSTLGAYSLEVYLVQMTFLNSINHSWTKLLLYLFMTVVVSILIHYLSKTVSRLIVKKYSKTT